MWSNIFDTVYLKNASPTRGTVELFDLHSIAVLNTTPQKKFFSNFRRVRLHRYCFTEKHLFSIQGGRVEGGKRGKMAPTANFRTGVTSRILKVGTFYSKDSTYRINSRIWIKCFDWQLLEKYRFWSATRPSLPNFGKEGHLCWLALTVVFWQNSINCGGFGKLFAKI